MLRKPTWSPMPRLEVPAAPKKPASAGFFVPTFMPYLKLFVAQAFLLVLIAVTHIAAIQWSLYWHYIWLDVPVHFAGGMWLALAGAWMFLRANMKLEVTTIFSLVIILSIAWEIFELAAGVPIEESFALDTVIDLTMDVFGGILGFLIAHSLSTHATIPLNEETENSTS